MPGALVCVQCWEQVTDALGELPELYEALLEPPRRPSSVGRVSASFEPPLLLRDEARLCREWVIGVLREWCGILSKPIPEGRALSTGEMDVEHMADRLMRHTDWLVANPVYADQYAHDIRFAHRDARRTTYRTGPLGLFLGPCPDCEAPVRAINPRELIECPGCRQLGDPWWWREKITRGLTIDSAADAYAIAMWISVEYAREINVTTIRQWASAGTRVGKLPQAYVLGPDRDASGDLVMHPMRRGNRRLYLVETVRQYVRDLYGAPIVLS
jgi:hypothetical protein